MILISERIYSNTDQRVFLTFSSHLVILCLKQKNELFEEVTGGKQGSPCLLAGSLSRSFGNNYSAVTELSQKRKV